MYVILGTFCYGLAVNLIKQHGQGIHPISFTAIGFIALGPPAAAVLGWTGAFEKMVHAPAWKQSMPALLGLALFCTVLANVLFNWLIQRTNAIFSSAIAYVIPCMALVWGGLDGEIISWFQLSGFAFILLAVYILRKQ
jgi:drug/metabolite transporter (DMT)-like permease